MLNTSSATSSVSRVAPVLPLTSRPPRAERVAVLLNANARQVTEGVRREITRHIPAEDVYWSRSLEESKALIGTILDRDYTVLLTGGGDGTFAAAVTEALHHLEEESVTLVPAGNTVRRVVTRRRPIRFGALHLGTGNAVAGLEGASSSRVGLVEDILRARAGDLSRSSKLNLISVEGKLAPFTGLGTDAKILNDFVRVKSALKDTPLQGLASGLTGYFMSVTGLSIPSTLLPSEAPNVEIINEGAPVHQIGPDGDLIGKPLATGEVLYRGPCRLLAAGTVPSYGFGFTIFPHALRVPGRMHLRLTAMNTTELLRHIPAIWKGRTPTPSILDFSAEKVRISFDRPMPFQIGGDAEGERKDVSLAVDPRTVDLLDFKA